MGLTQDAEQREVYFSTLMRAGLSGDGAAYRELLLSVRVILTAYTRGFLLRMGKYDSATAEDMVQEVLLALHTKRHTYDVQQPFLPWLFAIARYKLIDFGRRERRRPSGLTLTDVETALAAPIFQDPATSEELARLLTTLPEKARRALELVKIEGFSVAEAAAALQLSPSALKVTVHRSLKALRKRWQEVAE